MFLHLMTAPWAETSRWRTHLPLYYTIIVVFFRLWVLILISANNKEIIIINNWLNYRLKLVFWVFSTWHSKLINCKWLQYLYINVLSGYGFVDFENTAEASSALKALQGMGMQVQMAKVGPVRNKNWIWPILWQTVTFPI